ncbi:MAG: hypothetical protein M1324_04500 [Patescibacteria group bacterium]|nr:hypothetical protein [Patescibacteria group bacterium]
MGEAIKAITIRLSLNRLQGLLVVLGIVLVIAGFQFNKFGLFSKAYAWAFKSEIILNVIDSEKNEGLAATISMVNIKNSAYNRSGTADKAGALSLNDLIAGDYRIEIKYAGYKDYSADLKIKRGKNSVLVYKLGKKPPEQAAVSGVVKNYINESTLSDIAITIGDLSAKSDTDGKFTITKVVSGEKEVVVKQKGYLDYSKKVTITGKQFSLDPITLVPVGKVVYISNKDKGKRGIYTSNYDGSDAKPLIDRVADHEDFSPAISPDYKKVAFLSTRDGQKDGASELNSLYTIDIDGKNLTKIGDRADYSFYWSTNSKYLIWTNSAKENDQTKYSSSVYNISAKSNKVVITNSSGVNLRINDGNTKIAYIVNNSGKYELNIYDIGAESANKVYDNTTSYYLIKFSSDTELIYGSYQNNQQKYFTFNLGDNSSKETDYQYPKRYTIKSPNGKIETYIESRDGKSNLFVADDSSGKNEKQLSTVDAAVGTPYWSTDSKLIFFNVQKTGESALYVVSVDGGTAKKIIDVASDGYMGGYAG